MAWFEMGKFRMGNGSRRAKPKRVRRFEPADRVVVNAFADLQQAHHLKCNQFSVVSARAVEQFEREVWRRLIDYLVRAPLQSDS